MSSTEAEQAAETRGYVADTPGYLDFVAGYKTAAWEHDAAIAKLREELDFIKTEHAILNARLHGEVHPKDNGDWHGMINIPELLRKMAEKDAIIMRSIPDPTDEGAIEQLAHQQPSAPTPEPESLMTPEQGKIWGKNCTAFFDEAQKANAKFAPPAPDVEKLITKEGALAYFKQFLNGDKGVASAEVLADIMITVQHQARTPLVAALEEIRATGDSSVALKAWQKCLQIADAALTGEKP